MMTEAERAHYCDVGWAIPKGVLLPDRLIGPVRQAARAVTQRARWQEMLSGIHNPFGHHACVAQAWQFLDIGESEFVLDLVETVLGPDIVFWDSELYHDLSAFHAEEIEWWPADPLAGTIVLASMERGDLVLIDIRRLREVLPQLPETPGVHYALRYMPATSHFNRDPRFASNRRATAARVLVDYTARPIWLVRGEDRVGNDFATGFAMPPPQWAGVAGSQGKAGDPGSLGTDKKER